MKHIARFSKVSYKRFCVDWNNAFGEIDSTYHNICLPRRATIGSAGYDFFCPAEFTLMPGESIQIPTGIRVHIETGWVLMLFPRSGLGFRYRIQLDNTVGVIDSDYFHAANEGHIQIKLTNGSLQGKTLHMHEGEAFAQGIFLPFGLTEDDDVSAIRTGGFGSTNIS